MVLPAQVPSSHGFDNVSVDAGSEVSFNTSGASESSSMEVIEDCPLDGRSHLEVESGPGIDAVDVDKLVDVFAPKALMVLPSGVVISLQTIDGAVNHLSHQVLAGFRHYRQSMQFAPQEGWLD